jgi:hypothetical protein
MKFAKGIDKKYRRSVEDAFEAIVSGGNNEHRRVASLILDSDMLVRVRPVREVNASGVTGLIDAGDTNDKIEDQRISLREAFDEIYIAMTSESAFARRSTRSTSPSPKRR